MVEREEKGAKCLFLRVWVGTQKIPIILNKIKFKDRSIKLLFDVGYTYISKI